jgi:hypothetical protein
MCTSDLATSASLYMFLQHIIHIRHSTLYTVRATDRFVKPCIHLTVLLQLHGLYSFAADAQMIVTGGQVRISKETVVA